MTKSSTMNIVVAVFGVLAMLMAFVPMDASANGGRGHRSSDDVNVSNSNGAIVVNGVSANANTGGNTADGGNGSGGGNGGNVVIADDNNDGGAGGNGGNGGNGGIVVSGDAIADAGVLNVVNSNATDIDRCGCEGGGDGDITVRNRNHAFVGNYVGADANTGRNSADGGHASGNGGGEGGNVVIADDNNTGGRGGNAGHAGNGGRVDTWDATSNAGAVNIVNTNLTRVRG